MAALDNDTISAIATATGRGGIGIVRLSGPSAAKICAQICGATPQPRTAKHAQFKIDDEVIDEGIALFFPGPNSFTGEDVVELQGHGGTHVLNILLRHSLSLGARMARPGEFTERAFLNDKIDLLQAEAIADLVDASSEQAARSAVRTLQGVFSAHVNELALALTAIRVNVEAAIDFTDEDIDVMAESGVVSAIQTARDQLQEIFKKAQQGALMQEGIDVVIAGAPNAGKSSLLNALAGGESAIVTDIPGTTRDLLKQQLNIEGLPVHITDTAGLRSSSDVVEQEGIRRARAAIDTADLILLVVDGAEKAANTENSNENILLPLIGDQDAATKLPQLLHRLCIINNKADLQKNSAIGLSSTGYQGVELPVITLSAKTGLGLDLLHQQLKACCGFESAREESFIARERHLEALRKTQSSIDKALLGVSEHSPLELVAEDLRIAHSSLGTITGKMSSDDLLGEIFSSFCIGK